MNRFLPPIPNRKSTIGNPPPECVIFPNEATGAKWRIWAIILPSGLINNQIDLNALLTKRVFYEGRRNYFMSLQIAVENLPGAVVVKIIGDVGVGDSGPMETGLMRVSAGHPQLVILDMSGVGFISSLGMGSLVSFRQGIVGRGGKVLIAEATTNVSTAIKRARLDSLLPMFDSVTVALGV
jgi:anti-anti-sigma factor